MFDTLSDRLSGILDKITGRGALSDADVEDALREAGLKPRRLSSSGS